MPNALARLASFVDGSFWVLENIKKTFRRSRLRRKLIGAALIFSYISMPVGGFVTLRDCTVMASTVVTTTTVPLFDLVRLFKRLFGKSMRRQEENTQTRTNRVSNVSITPGKIVGYQGQTISFSAIGKD